MNRDEAFEAVCEELRRELELPGDLNLTASDPLDLIPGAESIRLMRVVAALEGRYDVEFDDHAVRDTETIGDMTDLVLAALKDAEG
ncbi:acyl carrier protein [Actinomadura rubrisoli]|uniref:acyl carrier protein n=1 Tax=Actinomadura rubrisoli TaxID=2530368 RepID=UPI001404CD42|nr:acyl carrier protein [Actinomadura rubrisoli]